MSTINKFGSDEEFAYIKRHIGDGDAYVNIYNNISGNVKRVLYHEGYHLKYDEIDSIVEVVQIKIYRNLVRYIEAFEGKAEAQRNAWFYKVVMNTAKDYFRSRKKDSEREEILFEEIATSESSVDTIELALRKKFILEDIVNGVRELLTLRSAPEKIISYMLMKISAVAKGRDSGSPKEVASLINGKTILEAYDILVVQLADYIGEKASEEVLSPFLGKLNERVNGIRLGDKEISFSSNQISNDVNHIAERMHEKWKDSEENEQ